VALVVEGCQVDRSQGGAKTSLLGDLLGTNFCAYRGLTDSNRGFTDVTFPPSFPADLQYVRILPISQDPSTEGHLSRRGLSKYTRRRQAVTAECFMGHNFDFVHTDVQ
jgi:hypothetical protein